MIAGEPPRFERWKWRGLPIGWRADGTTRFVLLLGPVALKCARGERGRRCNRFEADLYKRTSDLRRTMLCPVLWCAESGSVLMMRAVCALTKREHDHLLDNDALPDWDYVPPDESAPFEYKRSDWGWLDGRVVAVDYSTSEL
jgi:hypothetical protein